jgi:hypothetical protein
MYADSAGGELEAYASAAAALLGLSIRDEWWPGVVANLRIMFEQATFVSSGPGADQDVPAPVFTP